MFLQSLDDLLKSDPQVSSYFLGVITADHLEYLDLENLLIRPWVLVCNTLCSYEEGIGHFVAFLYENGVLKFFDSLGGTYQDECNGTVHPKRTPKIKDFLWKIRSTGVQVDYVVQCGFLQNPENNHCGEWVCWFVKEACSRGFPVIETMCKTLYEKSVIERDDFAILFVDKYMTPQATDIYRKDLFAISLVGRFNFTPEFALAVTFSSFSIITIFLFLLYIVILVLYPFIYDFMEKIKILLVLYPFIYDFMEKIKISQWNYHEMGRNYFSSEAKTKIKSSKFPPYAKIKRTFIEDVILD